MSTKNERRITAQKKAKQKKIAILAVCAACAVALIAIVIFITVNRPDARVFSIDNTQMVTLYENGVFSARLPHDRRMTGTFTEQADGAITFAYNNNIVNTRIVDDVLILPTSWRVGCAHGHSFEFPLRR